MKRLLLVSLIFISGCKPATSPSADLSSPSQAVRDAAAAKLRATAKAPSKLRWFVFTCHLKKGENVTNIMDLLRSYNLNTNAVFGMGSLWDYEVYNLDNYWNLECWFDADNSLSRWKLSPGWQAVAVWPSTNFNGVWINYFANGQKFTECYYTNGLRNGGQITFFPDGSKSGIDQFENGVETSFIHYFPSGRIYDQGQWSNHAQAGIWIEFNKDGSTNRITDYSKPRTNIVISPK